jgi:hypothetical protein
MVWNPQHGQWSEETFDSSSGTSGSNTAYQNITGGYLTLIPQVNEVASYFHPWEGITNWTISNSLNTQTIASNTFQITGYTGITKSGPTGYQKVSFAGGSWEIYTEADTGSVYSEAVYQALVLSENSTDTLFASSVNPTVNPFTVEFDVASIKRLDSVSLPGFTTGQNNLTGLPALSGWLNHGVYLSVGENWDYLECRPDGIRSLNHPEFALPIDLKQPKKIRLGIDANNIYLLGEDSSAVVGLGKFNTVQDGITGRPVLAFGAPRTGSADFTLPSNISGFAGHTFWDNIRVLTGECILDSTVGNRNTYATGDHYFYTAPFYPGFSLKDWRYATINYVAYPNGSTVVTPQYEYNGSFTDYTAGAISLTGQTKAKIDLTDMPVYNYVNNKYGVGRTGQPENAIRFKIKQSSDDGSGPAPVVDNITVYGTNITPYLELTPNWKPYHRPGEVTLTIDTKKFYNNYNTIDSSSKFFLKPHRVMKLTGSVVDELGNTGSVLGTGEYVDSARWDYSFQNYSFGSGIATTGTDANKEFGTQYVTNYIPDPLFQKPFHSVTYQDTIGNTVQGGELGYSLQLPPSFSSDSILAGTKQKIHRTKPGIHTSENNYAQRILISKTTNWAGVEAVIPSGILAGSGKGLFSCDIKMLAGSGISLYASGSVSSDPHYIGPDSLQDYARVSLPVDVTGTSEAYIGILAYSGHTGMSDFIIDNLNFSPYTECYLKYDSIGTDLHRVGIPSETGIPLVEKASTCFDTFLFLDAYPKGDNVLFEKLRDSDDRGIKIWVDQSGYPIAKVDFSSKTWASGDVYSYSDPDETNLKTLYFTGYKKIPLGRWTHFGAIHQAHNYRGLDQYNISGHTYPGNVSSSNRFYMTVDGYPIYSEDCLRDWLNTITIEDAFAPDGTGACPSTIYVSDGTGSLVLASGLHCKLENPHYNRPPVAEAEEYMTIRASRAQAPYFIPDVFLQAGHRDYDGNVIANNTVRMENIFSSNDIATDICTQSIYNLDGPSDNCVWDHGSSKNHLIFFGDVQKDTGNSPYNTGDLNTFSSTRFSSGYGRNYYSSSTDRFVNQKEAWSGSNLNPHWPFAGASMTSGSFYIGGWFYPREAGNLLELVQNDGLPDKKALVLSVTSNGFRLSDRDSNGDINFSLTGSTYTSPISGWSHVGFYCRAETFEESSSKDMYLELWESGQLSDSSLNSSSEGFTYLGFYPAASDGNEVLINSSSMFLGRTSDCSMADVFMSVSASYITGDSPIDWSGAANPTGIKGKGFTLGYQGTGVVSGQSIDSFYEMKVQLPIMSGAKQTTVWAGTNWYNSSELSHLQGVALYPSYPFKESTSYYYKYDPTDLNKVFGGTDSPIRLGRFVPPHATNLARVDSIPFSVAGSISTIDMSDYNSNNLSTYRGGQYTLNKTWSTGVSGYYTGSYKAINQDQFSGHIDIQFYNQIDNPDLRLTSMSVASREYNEPQEAYYAYLIGRGEWGVKVNDALPHPEKGYYTGLTGEVTNGYMENLEKIKSRIHIRDNEGNNIDSIYWDIIPSPFSPDSLSLAVDAGHDIYPDGLGSGVYSGTLENGVFSVVLYSPTLPSNDNTIWIHYPGYRLSDGKIDASRKEIYNPIPLMRKSLPYEYPAAGQFTISVDQSNDKYYNLTVHGLDRSYTGYFF